jgi:hypothetical protein
MRFSNTLRAFFVAIVVALGASSAFAQGYYSCTPQTVGSRWVTVPTSGTTTISFSNVDDANATIAATPFPILYWGTAYTSMTVCTNGYIALGSYGSTLSATNYSPIAVNTASGTNDGIIEVAQRDLYGAGTGAACRYWTDGTTPNRRFIVTWSNWDVYANTSATLNFQAQFGENGTIVFSYLTSTWTSSSFGVGLDCPGSTAYCTPNGATAASFTTPTNDYQFSSLQISGRVLYDRIVTDASGIGSSEEYGLPLAGMVVAQLDSTGNAVGSGITDASGNFTMNGSPIANGSLAVMSGSTACNVRRTFSGALYAAKLLTNYNFTTANPMVLGTLTLNDALDPTGSSRAPINIARTLQSVYDWARARAPTTKTIQLVDPVLYDDTSALPTSYTAKNGATLASMRVSSGASGNPDAWDTSVLRKVYGRHILGAIAADPGGTYDATFDAATTDSNAFAEAFGYYLNAVISSDTKYFDGINATTTIALDMENPTLVTPKATNVAGWLTAALYDLVDGVTANEPWDTFDGTGAAGEQVFLATATLPATTPVTSTTFFSAWIAKGYDATSLARNFIRHGALVDDADEPNDFSSEATAMTQFGFVRTNRILNQFNDDYYRFTMAYPTNVLTVDFVYDRSAFPTAQVLLELQNAAGGVVGTGAPVGVGGPVEVKSGTLPAGDYLVHAKLLAGGGAIPKYTLQAFSELAFTSGSFPTWTLGRPINVPVNVTGGIPPYGLVVDSKFLAPPGLILDGANGRVAGSPSDRARIPAGGSYTYGFILSAQDSAAPTPNLASGSVTFTVNDELKQHFSPFTAFAFGKPVDIRAPFAGGTPPFTVSIDEGALPHGLAASGGAALRFTGTPDSPGSNAFTMTGTDFAGSTDTASTTGVACVPLGQGQAALGAGASACGFYIDVVKGSTVALTVATVKTPGKRSAPRALRATILDKDGSTVLIQPGVKAGKGKVASGKFTAPSTGRFFFVVSSDDGGAQALLSVKAKIVADKGGKGDSGAKNLVSGETFPVEIGALAGSTLTFTAKPAKNSGLLLKGAYLLDPAGNQISFVDGEVTQKPDGSIAYKRTLTISGTWTFVVGAENGPQGQFSYAFTLKEPAKAVYSAD